MGLIMTASQARLSPYKERKNQYLFLVMLCSAMDLRDTGSGISREWRESARNRRTDGVRPFPQRRAVFPPITAKFPLPVASDRLRQWASARKFPITAPR